MKLTIIGASGHGKVAADIARLCGYSEIEFLDDDPARSRCGKYPVVGTGSQASTLSGDVFVAIGSAAIRRRLTQRLLAAGRSVTTLIHPNAIVSEDVTVGCGVIIMAGAVINPGAVLGDGVIINTAASVDHDCHIGDFAHIAVGSHLCGEVTIGDSVWLGAGSTVIQCLSICPNCTIGAGAVVIDDIREPGTYVGVPAKRIREER